MPTGSICSSPAKTDSAPSSNLQITGLLNFTFGRRMEGQPSSHLLITSISKLNERIKCWQLHKCRRRKLAHVRSLCFSHSFLLTYLSRSIDRYYMQHSHPSDEYPVQAFPEGFRMLVGNPYVRFAFPFLSFSIDHSSSWALQTRSYDDSSAMAKGIGWNCLGGEGLGKDETKNPWFPTVNCAVSIPLHHAVSDSSNWSYLEV